MRKLFVILKLMLMSSCLFHVSCTEAHPAKYYLLLGETREVHSESMVTVGGGELDDKVTVLINGKEKGPWTKGGIMIAIGQTLKKETSIRLLCSGPPKKFYVYIVRTEGDPGDDAYSQRIVLKREVLDSEWDNGKLEISVDEDR